MRTLHIGLVGTIALGAAWAGCQPRNVIPSLSSTSSTVVSTCDKLPNCGQCVSDARCGWCSGESRCVSSDRGPTCQSGWIAKDPEQLLCPADPPSKSSQGAK